MAVKAGGMPRPRAPKAPNPNKAIMAAPRLKAIETRNYGKGLTPLSQGPNTSNFGVGAASAPGLMTPDV